MSDSWANIISALIGALLGLTPYFVNRRKDKQSLADQLAQMSVSVTAQLKAEIDRLNTKIREMEENSKVRDELLETYRKRIVALEEEMQKIRASEARLKHQVDLDQAEISYLKELAERQEAEIEVLAHSNKILLKELEATSNGAKTELSGEEGITE